MFIPHAVNLSIPQRKKLLKGLPVQLKNEHLTGGMVVLLDHEQAKRYKNAVKHGKGLRVQFRSPIQIDHNLLHGKGFQDVLNKVKKFGQKHIVPVFKKHGQKFAHEYAPKLGNHLKNYALNTIDSQDIEQYLGDELGKDLKKMAKSQATKAIENAQKRGLKKVDEHLGGYEKLYENEVEGGKIPKSVQRTFRNVGRVLKNKLAKPLLKGVVETAVPVALAGLTSEMGGVGALATPLVQNSLNKVIDGMGTRGKKKGQRKMTIGLTGKALLPA